MGLKLFPVKLKLEIEMEKYLRAYKKYMNVHTGSVDVYGWWYSNETGEKVNAVDLGEVVAVEYDSPFEEEDPLNGI